MISWYFYDEIYDLMGADYKQHFNLITCNIKVILNITWESGYVICIIYYILSFLYNLFLFLFLVDTPTRTTPEREIICVTLKKDPKLGFGEWKWTCIFFITLSFWMLMYHFWWKGFVIVGEDNTGKFDLGIFIASIVPDGPADRDGRIRPGKTLNIFPLLCHKKKRNEKDLFSFVCV